MLKRPLSWSQVIRKSVYQMIILIVMFSMIAFFFSAAYRFVADKTLSQANDYHLTSTFHYLRVMEELRHIQLFLVAQQIDEDTEVLKKNVLNIADLQESSVSYDLIKREVNASMKLQQLFNDERFLFLTYKLASKMAVFRVSYDNYFQKGVVSEELYNDIGSLLITLNQLVKLHTVSRDELLESSHVYKNNLEVIQLLFFSGLLLGGIFIAWRGLKTINVIVSEQQSIEEKIRYQAHFDSLTDIPNRFLSVDRLSQMINEARRCNKKVAAVYLDLDDFKKVNDTLGHNVGDSLLVEAAQRLKSLVRSCDTVGRLGGDEFIIILGGLSDLNKVGLLADNLINRIQEVFKIDGHDLIVTASVGISVYPEDGGNAIDLMRNADSAMYHSKKLGRNKYSYFTNSMNVEAKRLFELEKYMHGALAREEFSVVYQPKYDLHDGRVMGVEALLRWHSSALGFVGPDEFIPVAEQSGLIKPIGMFVLSEALRANSAWQKKYGTELNVAVNVSPIQFRDPKLINSIKQNLLYHGVPNHCLELEITEGVLMNSHCDTELTLDKLSRLGIGIAMDDFGTGYSSLSYLRQYPFDVVKIDRTFVNDMFDSKKSRELINAAIAMAHNLQLKVVAEGVETQAQLNYLKENACDYGQGYFFSKPISELEMTELLAKELVGISHLEQKAGNRR